jgi:hypothetical protein
MYCNWVCPFVNGKASKKAIECSVSVIIFVGISPFEILQKIQSIISFNVF